MSTRAIHESDFLAPRDPALDDNSDDWPEFELKDVKVHIPEDPSQLTSLLDANNNYPLTLTGHLEPLSKEQVHLQVQSTPRRAPLIEVTDVRSFSYGQFEDGNIGLWAGGKAGWFLLKPARAYRSIWSSMAENVRTLYWIADAYREKRGKGVRKYTAEQLFDKYADEKLEDAHGGKEAAQVIYEQRHFLLACMLAGKEGLSWAKIPLYAHLIQQFPEDYELVKARWTGLPRTSVNDDASKLKRKRGGNARDSEEATSTRENSVAEGSGARSKREASNQQSGKPAASRRTRRGQLQSASPESGTSTPREKVDSDDDHFRKSMKGRSALRPKASKVASKGASKGGKAPVLDFTDDSDDPTSSPIAAKRRHSHQDASRPSKRRNSSKHDVDEGIDIPSSPASDDIDDPSTPSDTIPGAADGDSDDEVPSTELAVRLKKKLQEPDPIQEDTWVCALDGCTHKVYLASKAESQRLIREHYVLHASDDDPRVQLVKKLQHPSLPTGNLLEKVRQQARTEGFPGSRSALEGANAHSRYRPVPSLPQVRY